MVSLERLGELAPAMKLSAAQYEHLSELIVYGDCDWGPATAGEWAVARALERKHLLSRNVEHGRRAYSFSIAQFNKVADGWLGESGEGDGCCCGNGEAEDDRSAVLRCPVHGPCAARDS